MKFIKIFCFFLVMALILGPVSATNANLKVEHKYSDQVTSTVQPYFILNKDDWGHLGSWSIKGAINYRYPPTQPQDYTYYYSDSGRVLPLYTKYWGYKVRLTFVKSYHFQGQYTIST